MDAVILSVGDEIVTGATIDTNSAWLAGELSTLGFRPRLRGVVRDDRNEIAEAMRRDLFGVAVLIVTGGLGPTADDLTREGLADALDVELRAHPAAEQLIREFYQRLGRSMPATTMRQANLPTGAEPIPNPRGTAPGVHVSADGNRAAVFLLPGPPAEMHGMFRDFVRPRIKGVSGGSCMVKRVLRTFGMSEAALAERIEDLMAPDRNPHVGVTASETLVSVRINATAASMEEAAHMADHDAAEVRSRLGQVVYGEGDDTLASVVGAILARRRRTLAAAESCTGGLVSKLLTDVPGSSAYFIRGYVTYSNASKVELLGLEPAMLERLGAVSAETAEAMARGCRAAADADHAISITGIAGPTGGSVDKPIGLVYVGVADKNEVSTHQLRLGSHLTREQVRDRAAKAALNLLRLGLLKEQGG
ncbi:MAG: competence/damage-inducible protein A [Gemmatimonadaceae bacterium]